MPDEILHGKKEAFSDAVGLSWKEAIKQHAEIQIKDQLKDINLSYESVDLSHCESIYFKYLFARNFEECATDDYKLWLPNQTWVRTGTEPSARVLSVYGKPAHE